jgi:MATE family multidrug resistance protein
LRTGFLLGTKTLATAAAARLGPSAAGAHLILSQLWSVASMALDALAVAGQTLVAVELGKGDRRAARQVGDRLLQLGALGGVALAVALALSSSAWPRAFSDDAPTLAAVGALWPLAVAPLPMNAVIYVLDGVMVGAGDFKFLCGAMAASAMAAAGTLAATEGALFGLGTAGAGQDAVQALAAVWAALAVLMGGRVATLLWRYWYSPGSPLALVDGATAAAAEEEDKDDKKAE